MYLRSFQAAPLGRLREHLLTPIAAALLTLATAPAWGQLTQIGPLPGGASSTAYGVSGDGSVVVGNSRANGWEGPYAWRWTAASAMVDLGWGTDSNASAVSSDGLVVVGHSIVNSGRVAISWTSTGGMVNLGTLPGGGSSGANAVSADGSVVVGWDTPGGYWDRRAWRWTSAGGMVDLGTLGGTWANAQGVSADGSVVVGTGSRADGEQRAWRWTSTDGMLSLGTLGGNSSFGTGVSADGSVVVGDARLASGTQNAFRWTATGGMVNLGTLGGDLSWANGVSANGRVVVGFARTADYTFRAFRWTEATGMQSVEDWLRASGVTVPADMTYGAFATNSDGSVVVGQIDGNTAFIARGSGTGSTGNNSGNVGSGLITLADVSRSLDSAAMASSTAMTSSTLLVGGAQSRPLTRRAAPGANTFWVAGDLARDEHSGGNGDLAIGEIGVGRNFGPVQVNASLGMTKARQNLSDSGRASTDGTFVSLEALHRVSGNVWATVGAWHHWGRTDLSRGYLNAGMLDASSGRPDVRTTGLRARLDWEAAATVARAELTPYVALSRSTTKLDAYTEIGGGFPARFDARKDHTTESHLGLEGRRPLGEGMHLVGLAEHVHRFEKNGARSTGEIVGLFGFDLPGQTYKQDWVRAGVGLEGKVASGYGSLMLNATTQGPTASSWLAAAWRRTF